MGFLLSVDQRPIKKVVYISIILGIVLGILRFSEVRILSGYWSTEVYSGVIASIFLACGIFIGRQFIENQTSKTISLKTSPKSDLTERELEVLTAASEGLSNQEIADRLFISVPTVKTHLSNCYDKLQVKRRTQALLKAKELELL